jgi:hypothetical protein
MGGATAPRPIPGAASGTNTKDLRKQIEIPYPYFSSSAFWKISPGDLTRLATLH